MGEEEDNLSRIFRMQEEFDETVQNKPPFSEWAAEFKVVALLGHLIQEAYETRNEMGFTVTGDVKWWKNMELTPEGWEKVHEELIDCLHFLISAMLKAGLDAEDVMFEYEKKNTENHRRQEKGY